jgi:hypothetical protein
MKLNTLRVTLTVAAMVVAGVLLINANATAQASGDSTPPQVTIYSPTDGTTVSGKVSVLFTAYDTGGLMKFELYVDGELQQTILPNSRTQHFTGIAARQTRENTNSSSELMTRRVT